MTDFQSAELDEILSAWHRWARSAQAVKGFNTQALVVGQFRISRQYDDSNGQLDADLDALRCRQVDHEVRQLEEPHRSAIYVNARSLHTGRDVWLSPRLPENRAERLGVITTARGMLVRLLVSSGVM